MEIFDNTFFIWVLAAAVGLFVLRFLLNVTKKILTLGIFICAAVAVYILISNYLGGGLLALP